MRVNQITSLFFFILFLFAESTSSRPAATTGDIYIRASHMITEAEIVAKEGDLIVRMNQDPISQYIKNFNRTDKSFSHSGIVLFEGGYPFVYHMVAGDENPGGIIMREPLTQFCNPEKNFGFGLYRYSMDKKEVKRLKEKIYQWKSEELRFDSAFNLTTDKTMYCSEMVKKAIAFATRDRIKIATTSLTEREIAILSKHLHLSSAEAKSFRLVAIDNLYTNRDCRLVNRYVFF